MTHEQLIAAARGPAAWTDVQVEHVARLAAELGDTEVEQMCDEALADPGAVPALVGQVQEDPRYAEWMERGENLGWQAREGAAVTPATLTIDLVRDHLGWLQAGNYKLGEGPRAGLDRREAMRDCVAAIAWLSGTGHLSITAPERRDRSPVLARVCEAINARRAIESATGAR